MAPLPPNTINYPTWSGNPAQPRFYALSQSQALTDPKHTQPILPPPQPATISPQWVDAVDMPQSKHQGNDDNMRALEVVKVVYTTLIDGVVNLLVYGLAPIPAFGMEGIRNLAEMALAKKIYQADTPWAKKLIQLSSKYFGGPDSTKPVEKYSKDELRDSLSAISTLVTVLGGFCVALVGFRALHLEKQGVKEAQNGFTKFLEWGKEPIERILNKLTFGSSWLQNRKKGIHDFFVNHPWAIFPAELGGSVVWGLGEGVYAEKKAAKLEAKEKATEISKTNALQMAGNVPLSL